MLTVSEVCQRLHLSKYTVYRMIHAGTLRAVRVRGGRNTYLVEPASVEEFLTGDHVPVIAADPSGGALLTVVEVAARLRCSGDTVRRLIATGQLTAHRNPGRNTHLRITEAAVGDFLNANATAAVSA